MATTSLNAPSVAAQSAYHAFEPRPNKPSQRDWQEGFVNDRSTFSICLGGNGSGKTRAGAFKTARYLRETCPHRAGCPFWVIGETMDQICENAWVEKLSEYITPSWIKDIQWYRPNRSWPKAVVMRNRLAGKENEPGWTIEFRSYDQRVDAFKGTAIGGAWFNEEVPPSVVTEVHRGCRETNAPMWADFTPVNVKDPLWLKWYRQPPPGYKFWHLNTLENPYANAQWKKDFFAAIPKDFLKMRQFGDFLGLRGQVFKEWNPSIHVIPEEDCFDIPDGWYRWRAIDFGFTNPFCCLWFARGHDQTIYVYDEHFESQTLLKDHARYIHGDPDFVDEETAARRHWIAGHPHYGQTVSDHQAQDRAEMSELGIPCSLANKQSIIQSIERVAAKLSIQGDGRPRLFIFARCENLIREMSTYHFGEGTEHRSAREEPEDIDNHAVDALRYGVMHDVDRGKGFNAKGWRAELDFRSLVGRQ